MNYVTEANLYKCIFQSRKQEALLFQDWVTDEVLPTIRKYGAYMTNDTRENVLSNPAYLVSLAKDLQKEHERRKEAEWFLEEAKREIEELRPNAEYYKWLMGSESLLCASNIASEYDMQPAEFNRKLAELGVQKKVKAGGQWFLRDAFLNRGLTETATYWDKRYNKPVACALTKWTQKGHEFLYYFLKQHGILPVNERPKQPDLFDNVEA